MKWTPLNLGFGISLLVHTIVLGVMMVARTGLRQAVMEQEDVPITLILVAAPKEANVKRAMATVIAPAPVPSPTPQPVKPKPAEIRVATAVELVQKTVQAIESPAPVADRQLTTPAVAIAQPVAQNEFRGDASAIKHGYDVTTMEAQPGIKAKPNYLKNPEPIYPLLARRRHQEGLVLLTVTVEVTGKAASIKIKKSSGYPSLDEAALQAVREWEFEPARIDSLAVQSQIEVPVRFKLTP
jgi:periplasmic protein TonB